MRILAIDDDPHILHSLEFHLQKLKWEFEGVSTAQEAAQKVFSTIFDIIICDYRLSPNSCAAEQGVALIKYFRKQGVTAPVIMITARRFDEITPWDALEAGIDDFIKKPYHLQELIARIKVQERRRYHCSDNATNILREGTTALDLDLQELQIGRKKVHLGKTVFTLMKQFLEEPNVPLSYDVLIQRIWNVQEPQCSQYRNTLHVNISHLKKILGVTGQKHLQKIHRIGYMWKTNG